MTWVILFLCLVIYLFYIRYAKYPEYTQTEHMVVTDSTYSNCNVGCLIACSKRSENMSEDCLQVKKDCFGECVKQCWNF